MIKEFGFTLQRMLGSKIQSLVKLNVQKFIYENEHADEKALVLKHKTIEGVESSQIALQISGRRKAKIKLPLFYNTFEIIYPAGINLEQCSSEATAKFKSTLVNNGKKFIDLTGGFGIDSFFISKNFEESYYVEPNKELFTIAKHNLSLLRANNIHYHNISAEDFLSSNSTQFDLIFIDPSRRSTSNQKFFKLSDCVPDITKLQEKLLSRTERSIIKVSPLLDLQQGLNELNFVERIVVVSVENECKELLFICKKNFCSEPLIETINLLSNGRFDSFNFQFSEEQEAHSKFSDALVYLYEPNASILKAGAFKTIGMQFQLNKIHPSTHLYTSAVLVQNFPGRIFRIESIVKPDIKILQQYFPDKKANITTRNYPLSPEQLKLKTGLKDGGEKFLIGFSGLTQKFLVAASRIK